MAFTLDTQLGALLDNPQAKAIINQFIPGVVDDPMVAMLRGMTLNMVINMPQAAQLGLTREKGEMILAEINKRVK